MNGTCYLVGTPIGNLKDITLRALETLKTVDIIACEDIRHTEVLLSHYGIKKRLISSRESNAKSATQAIIAALEAGQNVAMVSDAGMPVISDPGAVVVRALREGGYRVEVVPGASAVVSAVALAAPQGTGFAFLGFLPEKKKEVDALLLAVKDLPLPLVFYCAPHDLEKTQKRLLDAFGPRPFFAVKELTKLHETVYAGTLKEDIIENQKGEFVLIVEPATGEGEDNTQKIERLLAEYQKECSTSEAVKRVARETGLSKNEVYAVAKKGEPNL